jgi:endonuclease/exonuclease/phosphatase family metal-dependent hydrolase
MSGEISPAITRRGFASGAIATAALAGATTSAQAAEKTQLRILCYNIHYGQGNDGVYDIPRLAEVIKAANPDVVALQEIDVHVERSGRLHELRILADETGMAARFGPTQHYEGGLFGNGFLSKLPYHDVHIQPLPYTESTPELTTYPRAAVAAVVEAPGGKQVRFISTHFQHNVPEDRLNEAKAINHHFANDDPSADTMGAEVAALPTILAGDLNATPGSDPITELQKKWTFAIEDPAVPSAPSKEPRSRIDYILHRTNDPFTIIEHEVIDEAMASDHCPVFAVFELG